MTSPSTLRRGAAPKDGPVDRGPVRPVGRDLLATTAGRRVLRSRWYPLALRIPVAAVFGLVAYELLLGPSAAHDNAGTALMWVLWWPLIPIMFVVAGRLWCAVCPFGAISDAVQRLVGTNRPVPRFLKRYGIWIIDVQFLLITWADHVWGIVESPWGSGILLLLLTSAVIASGAFFQRRTFCRYVCFLGGMCGNYARTGMVSLRANPDICASCTARAACYNGTPTVAGCPLFSFPRTMDSNAHCNLCANCIKACPNDAISLTVTKPTRDLWFLRNPKVEESFLAMAIMGIVLIQNVTMLGVWNNALEWIKTATGVTNQAVIFTPVFLVAVTLPVALMAAVSKVIAVGTSRTMLETFARFGYALIPLDVAAHIAHNLFHLLAEGKSVLFTLDQLFGAGQASGSTALVGESTIQILQFTLIALGVAASLYAAYRIGVQQDHSVAMLGSTMPALGILVVGLGAVNTWLFTMPMAMRM